MAISSGGGSTIDFTGLVGVVIKDIDTGEQSVQMHEVTGMGSTTIARIPGRVTDLGSLSYDIYHDPAVDVYSLIGTTAVLTLTNLHSVSGLITGGETYVGEAVLESYSAKQVVDGPPSGSVKFTWTGLGATPYAYTPETTN